MLLLNQNVYINNQDGTYTRAIFKGYSTKDPDVCFVKPKEKFVKGGYGMTITCLTKKVVDSVPKSA